MTKDERPMSAEEFWEWYANASDEERRQPLYEDQSMSNRRKVMGD